MIFISILLIAVSTIFETSLREIIFLGNIWFLFIITNLLFWHKRYSIAFVVGLVSSILTDLIMQNHFGATIISLFVPLLLMNFLDGFLKIEGKLSRMLFSLASLILSIVISEIVLKLLFLDSAFTLDELISSLVVSSIVLFILNLFSSPLLPKDNRGKRFL